MWNTIWAPQSLQVLPLGNYFAHLRQGQQSEPEVDKLFLVIQHLRGTFKANVGGSKFDFSSLNLTLAFESCLAAMLKCSIFFALSFSSRPRVMDMEARAQWNWICS